MKNNILKFIVTFFPLILGTIFSGIVFLGRVRTGLVDWKLYASFAGFVIISLLTVWFICLYAKKKFLN